VVHFGYVYDVWLELAHGTSCIWNYNHAQRDDKSITGYSL